MYVCYIVQKCLFTWLCFILLGVASVHSNIQNYSERFKWSIYYSKLGYISYVTMYYTHLLYYL